MNPESQTESKQTFLYRFLTTPRFRLWRHGMFIGVLIVISFNQGFLMYRELGKAIYPVVFTLLLTYIGVVYFNIYYLLPKYLLTRRYLSYILLLSAAMAVGLLFQFAQEYTIYTCWPEIYPRDSFFRVTLAIDYVSSFMMDMFCMIGGTMTVLLKYWLIDNKRVMQLEKVHIQSEVEQLKEQVSPGLLFKTLNRSGQLATHEPDKASKMLMKLSQLLRYQLYDCSREKVLLSAEINFLTNFLILEQLYSNRFDYTFSSHGEVNRTLLAPLLFIPFVQHAVKYIYKQEKHTLLTIYLEVTNNDVLFTCSCSGVNILLDDGLKSINQRLYLLYNDRYKLSVAGDIRLQLEGGER